MNEKENKQLEKMLKDMNDTELLLMYHASLKELLNRKINPLEEK